MNQYVVVKTLGEGAYGKVKLCLNSEDHNLYALKLVNKVSRCLPPPALPRSCFHAHLFLACSVLLFALLMNIFNSLQSRGIVRACGLEQTL